MSNILISMAIIVISAASSNYRRGGVALEQGRNEFPADTFTGEQLQQLLDDPRLTVMQAEPPAENPELVGVLKPDGQFQELEEMTVDALRKMAQDLEVEGAAKLKKADLVAAIKAAELEIESEGAE